MQIAISGTELDASDSINQLISAAKANDVQFIEIWYPKNIEAEGLERSLSMISDAGIRVVCVSTGTQLCRPESPSVDQALLIEAIELAHLVGASFANTYFGYNTFRDDERAIATYQKHLEPCLDRAEDLGVTIVLENEFDVFQVDAEQSDITRRPTSLRRLVEHVDSARFRITFDPCNYYFAAVEPFPYAYEVLQPYIAYVHVKDGSFCGPEIAAQVRSWKRFKDHDREFATRPLGQGAIDWPRLLSRLSASGYAGFLVLEPHCSREILDEAWKRGITYLREHFKILAEESA